MSYPSDDSDRDPYTRPLRHSGPGIASFVIGVATIVIELLAVGLLVLMVIKYPKEREPPAGVFVAAVLMIVGGVFALVGGVLGVVGLFAGKRKRLFASLGAALNGVILVVMLALVCVGAITAMARAGRP